MNDDGLTLDEAEKAAGVFILGLPLGMVVVAAFLYWWSQQ